MESEAVFDRPFCFCSWQNALETRLQEATHMYKFTYKISRRLDLSEAYIAFHRFYIHFGIIVAPFRRVSTHFCLKEETYWII